MVRTRITLDRELHARVRARAAGLGVSLAEYIRRVVDRELADDPGNVDRSVVFDLGASAGTDVASDKDRMIGLALRKVRDRQSAFDVFR